MKCNIILFKVLNYGKHVHGQERVQADGLAQKEYSGCRRPGRGWCPPGTED